MVDVASERVFAMVSAQVSAGDGRVLTFLGPQPPGLPLAPASFTGVGSVSNPMITLLELHRREMTKIFTPSATLVSGGSAAAIAIALGTTAPMSGIAGLIQGWPFFLSAAGNPSAAPISSISTASNQIRKVLVTIGMSALPPASSFALGGGTVQFVYGSAMVTSANAVTSGGQGLSYFDYVPLPMPSAGEVPVGWINVPNSFATSAGIPNSCMFTDFRATQGLNFSAMMVGLPQP